MSARAWRDRRSRAAARRARPRRAKHYACARRGKAERDRIGRFPRSNRPHLLHLGDEVPEQVLDAVAQRCGRGRAARAGAAHMEIDDALAIALEGDVAAVLGDRRAHARLEQLLDGLDRLLVFGRVELAGGGLGARRLALGDRLARDVMLHDGAENGGLEMLPLALALALGHADEVGTEEHALDALDLEQARGERRILALGGTGEFERSLVEHGPPWNEFQGGGIRRGFGLDEHGALLKLLSWLCFSTRAALRFAPAPKLRIVLVHTWPRAAESQGGGA